MATTKERERIAKILIHGYARNEDIENPLDIPSDIIQIIFLFYYIKKFNFEYSTEHIELNQDENKITNISNSSLNTTVVGDWMDPFESNKNIHIIKVKIDALIQTALIGIVPDYDVDSALIWCNNAYVYAATGNVYANSTKLDGFESDGIHHGFSEGDTVIMTLNFELLSLCCHIISSSRENINEIIMKPGSIDKTKYKWAIGMYEDDSAITVIDIT